MAMACEICGKKPSFAVIRSTMLPNIDPSPLEPESAARSRGDSGRAQTGARLHLLHPLRSRDQGCLKFPLAGRSPL